MKNFGIVSYNIYCNFTNYGSALQSWALSQAINKLGEDKWQSKLIDYCPDVLKNKDPLNPIKDMWDKDDKSVEMCRLSLPAIRENYKKFDRFYNEEFNKTKKAYTSSNFNEVEKDEDIDGFVCGSDTIFCIDEFKGLDDGYYANYDVMKDGYSISYAASFGDSHFDEDSYKELNKKLQNFKALGLREDDMIPYVKEHTDVEVKRVIDPTLLLDAKDYECITAPRLEQDKYLLLYARRNNEAMSRFAEKIAKENGWKVIEISLQATNASKHRMFYEAGVEEFLSLVKNAEFVVTNSYHGLIFSVQFEREFVVFTREQANTKISELMDSLGLSDRIFVTGEEELKNKIDYNNVKENISDFKKQSWQYLETNLNKMFEI